MRSLIAFLIYTQLVQFTFTVPLPDPTFDVVGPIIAAGAVAAARYTGAIGPGFAGGYPYNGRVFYGGPAYGVNPYYGGIPYGGAPIYPRVPFNRPFY
ncbi:hypothetical protein Bhyg_15653 [Pseudolycoriella hygida]|uniref:Uncharacterized protein n=1 Tax=Pseudolycoriella hygida TaxID=35572 RepID=A0A9Q0MKX8_9DIPT|nr:hypothetical protein Bhyg_15653 [Pseudolycoriella hygida]